MDLKLNTMEPYKEFYGRNTEQMPKLIADGRIPMNFSQLMQRRLDVRNAKTNVKSAWGDNYFDMGDAVAYHPDGRVKIVLDSQYLREMTPETQRNSGALVLTSEQYDAMDGEEFKEGKLGKTGEGLSKRSAKAHPVWRVLARDQALLNDYVDYIFAEGKERYDTAMGVYPYSAQGNTPEMRAWYVDRLVDWSYASGGDDLDSVSGRFVGIAPEALSAPSKGVSNIKTYTMADVQKAVSELEILGKVVKADSFKKVKSLVSKL